MGSTPTLRTDARLIAATNRDLAAMVAEQKFRADLYYRLQVFPIHVPPLRERREDIPLLVRHFAKQIALKMRKNIDSIPAETMNLLVQYDWPGNIRELQNVIERAVILSSGPQLQVPLSDLTATSVYQKVPKMMRRLKKPSENISYLFSLTPIGSSADLMARPSGLE